MNVKHFMMKRLASPAPDRVDEWLTATASIPEWHAEVLKEWHARNFSQDEAEEVEGLEQGFIRIFQRGTLDEPDRMGETR